MTTEEQNRIRTGSTDPDMYLHQNVTDPEHWFLFQYLGIHLNNIRDTALKDL
jgi:hypothetical protein